MTSGLQCIYNEGRKGKRDCDFLLIDMRNAYGEVSRAAILRGLYQYCRQLVRWFIIITYGEDTQLFHGIHSHVGSVCTGVKQGDPLSTLFFAVAIQAALDEMDEDIMNLHPGSDTAQGHSRTTASSSGML